MISHVVTEVKVCSSIPGKAKVNWRGFGGDSAHICVLPVTERRAVALGDLLHLVVVSQHKERLLEFAHFLHFGHHIFVDSIHDLLHTSGGRNSQLTLKSMVFVDFIWRSDCSMINNVRGCIIKLDWWVCAGIKRLTGTAAMRVGFSTLVSPLLPFFILVDC